MTTPSPSPSPPSTDDSERALFEAWAIDDNIAYRGPDGNLYAPAGGLMHAWLGFQAGRASATPAPAPDGWMPIETASQRSEHAKKD